MAGTGQTINDRLNAMRYALAGQGLARTVCKATTEEILGPKKKHLEYLVSCTNEPNINIPQLSNLLIERTQHSSWAVVFKSLISIHHLMSFGHEGFTRNLATSNFTFELDDFMDRTTPQGYGMSSFVRRYAKYINQKTISYRKLGMDLCKIGRGNDNALRIMKMDNLSKTLPTVQAQFDALLGFEAEAKDLNNGVILSAFRLLYKDLVKLYVAYQEAIINLLERYFKLSRKKAREALDLYKNYLSRMDKVEGFLKIVDAVGLDKSEMPDLTKSPASILEVLEKHLAQLEARKRGATPASPTEPDGEADNSDKEGANKENEPVAASGKAGTAQEAAGSSKASEPTNEDKAAPSEAAPAAVAPPKKPAPARPSPVASPKVSPSASRPKADATSASSGAPSDSKKAPPPSRPAAPPSRPPAPSNATPSSSQTSSLPAVAAAASGSTTSSKAPPHPPPPKAGGGGGEQPKAPGAPAESRVVTHETSRSGETPDAAESSASPSPGQQNHSDPGAASVDPSGAGGADEIPTTRTCSSVAPTDQQVAQADQQATVNHVVNNVGGNANSHGNNHVAVAEDEMPPPPPPIDEEQEPAADVVQAGVDAAPAPPPPPPPLVEQLDGPADEAQAAAAQEQPQAAEQAADEREPQINGQNGVGNGNGNNNAAGDNVVVD